MSDDDKPEMVGGCLSFDTEDRDGRVFVPLRQIAVFTAYDDRIDIVLSPVDSEEPHPTTVQWWRVASPDALDVASAIAIRIGAS